MLSLVLGFLALSRRFLLPLILLVAFLAALVWFAGYSDAILSLLGRHGDADEAASMAGRSELWKFVWEQIKQRPFVGHGFNSFESTSSTLWYGQPAASMEVHNTYVEVLYSCGFLGAVPVCAGVGVLLYRWIVNPDPPRDLIVWMVITSSFAEVQITTVAILPSLSFFLIVAMDVQRRIDGGRV